MRASSEYFWFHTVNCSQASEIRYGQNSITVLMIHTCLKDCNAPLEHFWVCVCWKIHKLQRKILWDWAVLQDSARSRSDVMALPWRIPSPTPKNVTLYLVMWFVTWFHHTSWFRNEKRCTVQSVGRLLTKEDVLPASGDVCGKFCFGRGTSKFGLASGCLVK
jgi:hypothetical protein